MGLKKRHLFFVLNKIGKRVIFLFLINSLSYLFVLAYAKNENSNPILNVVKERMEKDKNKPSEITLDIKPGEEPPLPLASQINDGYMGQPQEYFTPDPQEKNKMQIAEKLQKELYYKQLQSQQTQPEVATHSKPSTPTTPSQQAKKIEPEKKRLPSGIKTKGKTKEKEKKQGKGTSKGKEKQKNKKSEKTKKPKHKK